VTFPNYEIHAIRFAERDGRRAEHFLGGDPHDAPMATAYYVWLIRGAGRTLLVDTGFDAAVAAKRRRRLLRTPAAGLALVGVRAADIDEIVITHMHNDHAGTLGEFPKANFHLQDEEMMFASGRYMRSEVFRRAYEVEQVADMVRLVHARRVSFHRGDEDIAPGISLHHIGGHTAGMQAVRVHTRRGWVVLASDATHYYENFERRRCYPLVFHVGQMAQGYDTLARLAESPAHVIPGHDPLVMTRYPAAAPELAGIVARLDAEPL
jgi:glyoxylase-like metal-dependent hydrolase (beta-lactamase superfamily II)